MMQFHGVSNTLKALARGFDVRVVFCNEYKASRRPPFQGQGRGCPVKHRVGRVQDWGRLRDSRRMSVMLCRTKLAGATILQSRGIDTMEGITRTNRSYLDI